MTTLALVDPLDLLGQEVREELERRSGAWSEVLLLTTDEEQVGTISEFARSARLVARCDAEGLHSADLVFVCRPASLVDAKEILPAGAAVIFLGPEAPGDARPTLAWRATPPAAARRWWTSPEPLVVSLSRLLEPLAELGDFDASATVILPASNRGREAMDELFAQTQALLAFEKSPPAEVFGSQLAFNLLPAPTAGPEAGPLVSELLGLPGRVTVQSLQGNAFHGLSISAAVRFAEDPGSEALREALADSSGLEVAQEPERLGPIEVASRSTVLVGDVVPQPGQPGTYWLWAVADNLTGVGAHHAVALSEAVRAL